MQILTLKNRQDFVKLTKNGKRMNSPSFLMQMLKKDSAEEAEDTVGLGFTVSKKVGNAVVRNRVRRRLKNAAGKVMPVFARPGFDYVVVGRKAALTRPFEKILKDFELALVGIHKK